MTSQLDKTDGSKLMQFCCHHAIRDKNLFWIQYFLADRNQQGVLDGKTSSSAAVTSGVPQGIVL